MYDLKYLRLSELRVAFRVASTATACASVLCLKHPYEETVMSENAD